MNNFLYLVWYEEENKVLNLIAKLTRSEERRVGKECRL